MNYTLEIIKIVLALITILGIFFLVVKFIKGNNNLFNSTENMKVLEKCYLSSDKLLYLVKVADKVWLISSDKERVNFIEALSLDDLELVDNLESVNILNIFKKGKE